MKFLNSLIVFLVASNIVFAQVLQKSAITNGTFIASSFINDSEGWLADNNGKLWHTANGAQSWDSIPVEYPFSKLNFVDALNGFGLASNKVYETSNAGHAWSLISIPENVPVRAIYFLDENNGFISSYQMIYKTTDGGTNWSASEIENVFIHDFYFTGATVGLAVGNDDDQNRCIWRTSDGGLTWANVFNEENYYMNSVFFTDETTGWAAGYYDRFGLKEPAILKTIDGGMTWQKNYRYTGISSDGETLTDIHFKNALEGYALSVHNYDLYTTDGGESWNLVNDTNVMSEIPVLGLYKTLGGYSDLYLAGKSGNVAVWK